MMRARLAVLEVQCYKQVMLVSILRGSTEHSPGASCSTEAQQQALGFACDMPPQAFCDDDATRGKLGHACATARQSRPIHARAMRHTGHQDMSVMKLTAK